jgi:hypothetical protein
LSVAGAPLPSKHIEETNQTKTLMTRSEAEWLGTQGRQPVKRSKLNYRKRSKYVIWQSYGVGTRSRAPKPPLHFEGAQAHLSLFVKFTSIC